MVGSLVAQAALSVALFGIFGDLAVAEPKKTGSKNNDPPHFPLPPYVKRACSRNDPKVTECVMKIGEQAIKGVVKGKNYDVLKNRGDPKYKIPRLDPMVIEELKIQQGTKQVGLEIVCKNCLLYGLPQTKFTDAKVDWDKRECQWFFHLDRIQVKGKYNVSGQVLLLPIIGSGDAEFNFYDLNFSYIYKWDYYKRANWTYVNITDSDFPLKVRNMTIRLDNLFNGDKLLGGNMNRFINEHWSEILQDILPALSKSLADLTSGILTNMARLVPFDIMFPEKYDPNDKY